MLYSGIIRSIEMDVTNYDLKSDHLLQVMGHVLETNWPEESTKAQWQADFEIQI